jgi:hypothetical protein
VINFSEEEYIDYSVASYDAYKNSIEVDPYYFFNYNLFDDEFIDGSDVHYLKKLSYEIRREEYLRILKKKLHLG